MAEREQDTPARKPAATGSRETARAGGGNVQLKAALRGQSLAVQEAMLSPVQAHGGLTDGAPMDVHGAASEGVRGGGGAMPHLGQIQRAFGQHDVSNVQAHVGGRAAQASDAIGATAYATGNHVAFKDTPSLHTAAHEAAHVVQQRAGVSLSGGVGQRGDSYERHADAVADAVVQGKSAEGLLGGTAGGGGGAVQRAAVQREGDDDFDTWEDCYAALNSNAQTGYDQWLTLKGEGGVKNIRETGCKDKKTGKYLKSRAERIWAGKKMAPEAFDKALEEKKEGDVSDIKALLHKINHVCDETDGTNRPGSVGDGTSEWALRWEAEHGEPFRSPAGHGIKLRDYCKVIRSGIADISAKQGSVDNKQLKVRIQNTIQRAEQRYTQMKLALIYWNKRVGTWPAKWNPDGTSKVTPPGVEPLARNQLQAGWPPDATLSVP